MSEESAIERIDTGIRLLLSLLFLVIAEVVQTVLGILVAFSLLFALVTGERPSEAVRNLSNQVTAYLYRIYRYLTYNDARAPFPFHELGGALEPPRWSADTTESELLGHTRRRGRDGDWREEEGGDRI